MRGVVAGGMVSALDELGLQDAFDLVVGTSAGALAGAFFLAGQTHMGTSIYYEDLTGREWLDYRRAIRGSPIVALDYLLDEIMVNHKVLDCARVLSSEVPFYSVATRVPDYKAELLGNFSSDEELISALRASARIPLVAGKPVPLRGAQYIDGSLSEAIPLKAALGLGATHLLVLLTRPRGQVRGYPGKVQRHVAFPVMNRVQSGLGDAYAMRATRYAAELAQLEELQSTSAGGGGGGHLLFSWRRTRRWSVSSSRIPVCCTRRRTPARRRHTKLSPALRATCSARSRKQAEAWRCFTTSATILSRRSPKSTPTVRGHRGRMTPETLAIGCSRRFASFWSTTTSSTRR